LHPAAERLSTSHFHDHLVLESMTVSGSSCIGQFSHGDHEANGVYSGPVRQTGYLINIALIAGIVMLVLLAFQFTRH
jgi:hypothetical protein